MVQTMAWWLETGSHYLSYCWPKRMSTYGITRPQRWQPIPAILMILWNLKIHQITNRTQDATFSPYVINARSPTLRTFVEGMPFCLVLKTTGAPSHNNVTPDEMFICRSCCDCSLVCSWPSKAKAFDDSRGLTTKWTINRRCNHS